MLRILRKKGVAKKILWAVAVIIIISFGFFGVNSRLDGDKGSAPAGKVFGKSISLLDFQKNYSATENQAQMLYGENFYKVRPYLNLEQETWDRIILLMEAKHQRVKVSDDEVIEFIRGLHFFQRDGHFDNFLYKDILHYQFHRNPRDFEESFREQLTIKKLYDQQTGDMSVSLQEIEQEYKKRNEKIQVSYILFNPADYLKEVTVDEKEAKDYYASHKEEFFVPPTVNIEYVSFNFPDKATEEDKKATMQKANVVYEELTGQTDFKDAAQKNNLIVNTSGFFSMEQPNLKVGLSFEALQAIFKIPVGKFSEPLETPQGYQILRIKEKREAYVPEFNEAAHQVNDVVLNNKAKKIAEEKAGTSQPAVVDAWNKSPDKNFKSAAEGLGLTVQQTPFFARGEYLPTIGLSKEFQDAAYELTEEKSISATVATPKGFCIIHRDGAQAVDPQKFQKEKEEFTKTYVGEKKNAVITDYIARVRVKANLQDYLPKKSAEE